MHVEDKDEKEREYKRETMQGKKGSEKSRKKHYSNLEPNL